MGASAVRALVGLAVGSLLAGCGSSLPACSNNLSVDVRALAPLHAGSGGAAQVCLAQAPTCLTVPVTGKEQVLDFPVPDGMVPGPGVPAQGPVTISFTVTRDGSKVVDLSTSATLTPTATTAGGAPACVVAAFAATSTGLREIDGSQLPSTTPVVLESPSSTP
jgi:hypothetical protein